MFKHKHKKKIEIDSRKLKWMMEQKWNNSKIESPTKIVSWKIEITSSNEVPSLIRHSLKSIHPIPRKVFYIRKAKRMKGK